MAVDDLVPDEALVARLDSMATALQDLCSLAELRSHLPSEELKLLTLSAHRLVGEMNAAAQPDDHINAKYRSRMRNECCLTLSGQKFYIYDPKPEEVRHADLLAGLMHASRWAGQTTRFMSVMEHSIKVAAVVEYMVMIEVREGNLHQDIVPLAVLHAMLHDGSEYITGDIPGPYKARLADAFGTPWSLIEQRVQDAVLDAYAVPPIPAEVAPLIKQADMWLRYCECIALRPHLVSEQTDLQTPPPDVVSIGRVKEHEPPREVVVKLFDGEVRRLASLVGAVIPEHSRDMGPPSRARVPMPLTAPLGGPPSEFAPDPQKAAALEQFARAAQQNIPGSRPNPPPPKVTAGDVGYVPQLARAPRESDVHPNSWQQAVRSAEVRIPPKLMDAPEFQDQSFRDKAGEGQS